MYSDSGDEILICEICGCEFEAYPQLSDYTVCHDCELHLFDEEEDY